MIVGVILAGGRAERFGADKPTALLGGVTLIERVARVMEVFTATIAVNAPEGSPAALLAAQHKWPLAPDAAGDPQGPLSGVKAALAWGAALGADLVATAPCDTPLLPENVFARLQVGLRDGGVAVARTRDGLHPLCGLWRVSMLPVLETALAKGRHPPVRLVLDQIGGVYVEFSAHKAFANVNTPADLAAAEAQLKGS